MCEVLQIFLSLRYRRSSHANTTPASSPCSASGWLSSPYACRLSAASFCHRYDFLVCLIGTDLTFSNFLNFYSSLGIDHDPPCSLCSHDLCLFLFLCFISQTITWPREVISYYDLFNFGVLLFYRRISTLIFFHFLHNPTAPILPVYVDQQRPHLEKDTTWPRGVVVRKVPTVPRRTCVAPD